MVENGWYRGTPSEESIAWALEQEAALDAVKPNDFENFSPRHWQGFLAERAFATSLNQEARTGAPRWKDGPSGIGQRRTVAWGYKCRPTSIE